ncbi:MAG: metal-dependent hydrolase [Candidatus Nanohaloarchaea archaeon]|nr:metal-dependent hydrolase [Candidatus Nanohaloarchaea archaeon]
MPATHMLAGALIGAALAAVTAAPLPLLVAAGMAGGVFPDLDIVHAHRRGLHYPVLYGVLAVAIGGAVVLTGSGAAVLTGVLAAWTHSVMDIFAGAELRSWDRSEWRDKAVYDHLRQSWMRPHRLVYGGSFRDAAISLGIAIALFTALPTALHTAIAAVLLLGLLHALLIRYVASHVPGHHPTWASVIQSLVRGRL